MNKLKIESHWEEDSEGLPTIYGKHCYIWISKRPAYCDRGNYLAHIDVLGSPWELALDAADLWPRYYFDLDRAKLEIEAWMKKRKEWMEPEPAI